MFACLTLDNRLQQEAIGMLGVNLAYGAFHFHNSPDAFISSLTDSIGDGRVEVDMIEFNGPEFEFVDNRILCLKLAESGLTQAVMFDNSGYIVQSADKLYKKACLIERGSFRPLTKVNIDMLEKAKDQFSSREDVDKDNIETFMELTLGNLLASGDIDHEDFLARIEVINSCGYGVLVSNYFEYYKLSAYLREIRHQANWFGNGPEQLGRRIQRGILLFDGRRDTRGVWHLVQGQRQNLCLPDRTGKFRKISKTNWNR